MSNEQPPIEDLRLHMEPEIEKYSRSFTLGPGNVEADSEWHGIHPEKTIDTMFGVEFDAAEECIGFLSYTDGTFEVGIGEPLRPYQRLYHGTSHEDASLAFFKAVILRAGLK